MRILFVTPKPGEASGYGRYAQDVISGAGSGGHDVVVAVVSASVGDAIRCLRAARGADIVYGMDGWPYGVIAWMAARCRGAKLVIGAIGTYTIAPLRGRWYSPLVRRAYRSADAVIAISRYTRRRLLSVVPTARCHLITPGVDYGKWDTAGARVRSVRIISVGGVKPRKGHHALLEAFAIAKRQVPSLGWDIVGGLGFTPYVNRLKRRADELGVSGSIRWAGEVSDGQLRSLYAQDRVFILLSENDGERFEGFGIVFLEAAASGLAVVGTTDNGIADAVGPRNGILVPQRDADAAASAIVSLCRDDVRWRAMSDAGRAWAREHSLSVMHSSHELVYRKISGRT